MKPNDKAIEAALLAAKTVLRNDEITIDSAIFAAVKAAYAAQFQSEEYAGLIERLRDFAKRSPWAADQYCADAADAIETLLAKLNNKPKPSEDHADLMRSLRGEPPTNSTLDPLRAAEAIEALLAERDALRKWKEDDSDAMRIFARYRELEAERDALAARLAPVEDEALDAKAAAAIIAVEHNGIDDEFILEARAAIAAIRPHIEAAERERCAKDIKPRFSPKSAQQIRDETDRLIEKHRESVNDWLETGSWKQSGVGNE